MTGRLTVAAATAVVGGITLVGLSLVRPALDWPAEEPQTIQNRQVVDATGRVTGLDSQSVIVAPTVLGFNGRRFLLDEDTRILVGDKEGGVGDLQIGATVAVIYEPRPGGLLARWLGVNVDREALHRAALRSQAPPAASPPAPVVREQAAAGVPEHAASSTSQPPPRRVSKPPPRVEAGGGTPAATSAPKPEAAKARPPTPSNREGDDPGAVIDWLLRDARGK
jgi:hypothetical protein